MTIITALPGQSIFDIALMSTGVAEAAYDIALANGIDITDSVVGKPLTIPANVEKNKRVVEYYTINLVKPATFFETPHTKIRTFDESFDESFI